MVPALGGPAGSRAPPREKMALELLHGLVAVLRVTRERCVAISAQEARPAGSEDSVLAGHFALRPSGGAAAASTGTFLVSRARSEANTELRFHCSRGSLLLKREQTSWQLTVSDDQAGSFGQKTLERSVPCVGHRNAHQAFLEQVQQCTLGQGSAGSVDISVEHGLADTAIMSSIIASIKSNGNLLRFKYST